MKKIIFLIIIILIVLLCFIFIKPNKKEKITKKNNNIEQEKTKKEEVKIEKNNYVSYNGNLKVKDNKLLNQYDEKIMLKGISTHGIQWYGEFANKDIMKILKDEWNINLFRIAMYTEEGGYISNNSLKDKVNEIVEYAKELDLYVIIDWHILSDNNPNIHKEEAKLFFEEMALKYKNTPNILFEICNEPNGNASWDDVKRYANEIIPIIRKYSSNIIIVGTPTWSQDVNLPADDPLEFNNIVYSLHFYSGTHKEELRNKIDYALSKNIPIFVSEFGISDASGSGGVYKEEAKIWLDYLKEKNISFVVWSLSDKDESSALLLPGTKTNAISDDDLSESGKFIKEEYNR